MDEVSQFRRTKVGRSRNTSSKGPGETEQEREWEEGKGQSGKKRIFARLRWPWTGYGSKGQRSESRCTSG